MNLALAIERLHTATAIYTREPVVLDLLDAIGWPGGNRRLLDTSCGDGSFLDAALRALLRRPITEQCLDHLPDYLAGWEIHYGAALEARARITQTLVDVGCSYGFAGATARRMIRCADFLKDGPEPGSFDVIVGNPPYLRFLNVPEPLRGEYADIVPPHARTDLLHSFIDRSARVLSYRGELAMVTADRWLFNEGAAQLREIVGERFGLASLRRLDPASSFYRPKDRRAGSPPRIHPVAVVMKAAGKGVQPITRAPIFPGEDGTAARFTTGRTLGNVADVRLAPWLGTPGVFLIGAEAARSLPADALVPAVDTDDIVDGVLQAPTRYAIRTLAGIVPHVSIIDHLDRELPRMCKRGRARRDPWVPPETFDRLDLSQPSLLVPRIAKTLRPVRVPAGVLPVNHNLSIVRSGSMSLDEIDAVLRAPAATEWARRYAAPLENGYLSITTRLLRQLPAMEVAA